MSEQARAFAIYSALLLSVGGGVGFAGGRVTAPAPPSPPAEVRYVAIPMPAVPPPEVAPIEPAVIAPAEPVPVAPIEPPVVIETKPPPPKVDAKPKAPVKPQAKPEAKLRPTALKKSLPSCAVIKREYEAMSWAEAMAAYRRATPEEIAYGRRCLGK